VIHVVGFTTLVQQSSKVEPGQDLTDWLAERWWAPLVLCIGLCAVGLWMIRSMVIHRGRAVQIRRAAEVAGMRYSHHDSQGLSRTAYKQFANGDGRGWSATNVVTNRSSDGLLAHGFDARSWTELDLTETGDGDRFYRIRRSRDDAPGFSKVVRRYQGATRSAAVTELPLDAPRLMVVRENVASKLFAAATRVDFDVESEMFNRSYHVMSDSRAFARALLDARVVDLMARTEGLISFEFVGSRVLLTTVLLEPELIPGLVDLAEELRSVIPQLAVDRWPRSGSRRAG
jgi:hypothetical protein